MKEFTNRVYCVALALGLAAPALLSAEVRLPALISDRMLLQREMPARVWGKASPGETVTVEFRGQKQVAQAGADGRWAVVLAPMGPGPATDMTISGENRVTVADVLAGEVWVASGQSNMQWPVERARDAEKEIAEANFPSIRLFDVKRVTSETPQDDVIGAWKVCTPESVKTILAVGYFFAWDVHQERKIPVCLIHTSWGGTPAQAWTSMPALAADPALRYYLDTWDTVLATYTSAVENYERQSETWKSQ